VRFGVNLAVLVLVPMALAGCGSDSNPALDASGAIDASSSSDAAEDAGTDAASACAGPGDCPCFSNYDCPATHTCTSLDDTGENVWCLIGARGAGVLGDICIGEADCETALCVEDNSPQETFRCSDRCDDGDDCPAELPRCLFIGFGIDEMICAPAAGS